MNHRNRHSDLKRQLLEECVRHEETVKIAAWQSARIRDLEKQLQRLTTPPTEDDFRAARWQDMATAPDEGPYRMGWAAAFRWIADKVGQGGN